MTKALLVIDLQNEYFPGGKFPLWNADTVLQNVERAVAKAKASGIPVIHIQHVAKQGMAPFFNEGTLGANHPVSSLCLRFCQKCLALNQQSCQARSQP